MSTTRIERHIRAPRDRVYGALLGPEVVQHWMVPEGMTSTSTRGRPASRGLHEDLPPGVPPADDEVGWRVAVEKLARLVDGDP